MLLGRLCLEKPHSLQESATPGQIQVAQIYTLKPGQGCKTHLHPGAAESLQGLQRQHLTAMLHQLTRSIYSLLTAKPRKAVI